MDLAIELPTEGRSEVRSLYVPSDDFLCVSGMNGGPDTHRADSNAELLRGKGFVRCTRLEGR